MTTKEKAKVGKIRKLLRAFKREFYLTVRSLNRGLRDFKKFLDVKVFNRNSPFIRKLSKMHFAFNAKLEKAHQNIAQNQKKSEAVLSAQISAQEVNTDSKSVPKEAQNVSKNEKPAFVRLVEYVQSIPKAVVNSWKAFCQKVINKKNAIVYSYRRTKKGIIDWFWNKVRIVEKTYIFFRTLFLYNSITLKTSFGRNYGVAYRLDPYLEYKYLIEYIQDAVKQGLPHLIITDEYVYPEILCNLAINGFDIYVFAEGTSTIVSWYDAEKDKKGKVFSPWYYLMPYREMTFTPDSIITATQAKALSFKNQYKRVYRYMNSAFLCGESSTLLPFLVYLDIPHQILYKENLFCKVSIDEEHSYSRLTDIHIAIPDEYTDENSGCEPPKIIYDGKSDYEFTRAIEQYNAAQSDPAHVINVKACKPTIEYARVKRQMA